MEKNGRSVYRIKKIMNVTPQYLKKIYNTYHEAG